ncbi:MAG: EAL domain-containing protein, partial [Thermodesulfovibrionales bacterium]|nr:EAL domain-containing protein [Thermodesulfovibrionales bacterium]
VDRARLVQCNIRDITERKQTEKELKFRNIILSTQQEASIDGILVVDESNAIISYNQRFVEMWGIPPKLLESKDDEPVLQYVATKPVDPKGFLARVKYLYRHKEEKSHEDIALKDGRVFERYSAPMFGVDGRYYGRVWYFRDITDRKRLEAESEKLLHALGERVKELGCINDISRLAEEHWNSIEEFVQRAVGILPPAWRYPEICAARITLNSKEFKTANFRETEWSQSADIKVYRKKFGAVTICYLEKKPAAHEGPFLNEERSLINTVADFLGHIIQHRLTEEEIRASEEKFRVIFDNANDGILLADTETKKLHFANATICRMLGYSREESKNMGVMDIHPEKDIPYVIEQFEKQSRREIIVAPDLPMKRKDGSVFYADVSSALVEISGKHYLVGIFRDITERKHMTEKLQHLAYYDTLTDLPNRTLFFDRVNQAIARAEPMARIVAVLITNIDKFKSINDTYGSETGDKVLKEIAGRLSTSVRKGDTIARLSNDEFVIALLDVAHPDDIIMVLEKIIKEISCPLKVNGVELTLTFRTGVSLYPNDGNNASELLKAAGLALGTAKKERMNPYQFFTEDLNIKASELILMEKGLLKAITNEEFILHYQPYWDITTKKMVGMEALIRWQSKDKGLVPPGKFIPVLEDTGMIIEVGEWILRAAMRQVKEWQNKEYPVVPVSVNMSLVQFREKDLAGMVKKIMKEHGYYPSLLTLEITESAFMQDIEFTKSVLTAMKEIGCSVSIDDFGTGYSSLAYLKRFPVDNLKIDISFIREVVQDPDSASIVMAIINMAHTLNLKTIAEGIETEEQWNFLRLLRCDMGQGFYLSKPVPAADVERFFFKQQ